ncbi:lipopolysaccharide biosynthesis protein [Streptomyces sp. YIM 98790]|uniref:lipopolysaccharide biosynthesis protein n=1 Tax=Streptomyces sp. YIM 98790 TaxID=2689077 RepID=UPI00140CE2BB|nr:lipopolysaccharide biosynthesis protein [Streptomyces sp. YIM 98790]
MLCSALLSPIRRRLSRLPGWWPVAAGALLGLLLGGAYALLTPPRYAATSQVVAEPTDGGDPAAALGWAQLYGRLATDPAVVADAGASVRDAALRAATSPDAPVVEITATAASPSLAAGAADALARALIRYGEAAEEAGGARLSLLLPAVAPDSPVTPAPLVSLATAVTTGTVLGALPLLLPRRPRGAAGAAGPAGRGRTEVTAPPAAPGEPAAEHRREPAPAPPPGGAG